MILLTQPSFDQVLAAKTLWWTRLGFWVGIATLAVALIAALPTIQRWRPLRLSEKEASILRMAIQGRQGSEYFGVIWHFRRMDLTPNARGVGVPYGNGERIQVTDELIHLCSKGLLHQVTDSPQGDNRAVEYRLTGKGIKVAKKLVT